MTGDDLRRTLCGPRNRSFALSIDEIKQRLGEPRAIHLLPRWCRKTNRDVVVMSYPTEEGEADVFGAAGFLNGEQALLDGYVVVTRQQETDTAVEQRVAFATGQLTLFE